MDHSAMSFWLDYMYQENASVATETHVIDSNILQYIHTQFWYPNNNCFYLGNREHLASKYPSILSMR